MATFIGEISENTTAIPTLQLKMSQENEIKIALTEKSMATLRHRLALQGSRTTTQETLETNTLFDFEDSRLTKNGCALRMRSYGQMRLLTYKGPVQDDPLFKRRLELQTDVSDPDTMHQILASLGLEPRFKYSKIREIQSLTIGENRVEVSLDETPVGFFVELEGEPSTITKAIKILSLDDKQVTSDTYVDLYKAAGLSLNQSKP